MARATASATPRPPQPPAVPEDLPDPVAVPAPEHELRASHVALDWSGAAGVDARAMTLERARLQRPGLDGARLPMLSLDDTLVAGGSVANADLRDATWRRVELDRVRMTGARITDARLEDVVLRGCLLDLAALGGSRLRRVVFEECRLTGTDLQDLAAEDVVFDGCDLTEADLTGARFARTEMRDCTLDGTRGLEQLRGVGMRWEDVLRAAGPFAAHLGVRLIDG